MARRLGETLIDDGHLSPRQLQESLRSQRIFGGSLGTHLLQLGFVDEATLLGALARVHGVSGVTRSEVLHAPPEVVALLPIDYARRHRAIPFRVEGDDLHLALQNPSDPLAVHEAAFLTGFNIIPYVAPESSIQDALASHHGMEGPVTVPTTGSKSGSDGADVMLEPVASAPTSDSTARPKNETGPRAKPSRSRSALETPAPPSAKRESSDDSVPLARIGEELTTASSRDEIIAAALDYLASRFPRAAVFALRAREARLWKSVGFELPPDHRMAVSITDSSVLSCALRDASVDYGPVASTPDVQDFYAALRTRIPRIRLAVPVKLKERPILVLYADDPDGEASPPNFAEIKKLAAITSWSIEILILRAKISDASA